MNLSLIFCVFSLVLTPLTVTAADPLDFLYSLSSPCEVNEVPYVRCNESLQEEILEALSQYPKPEKGVHIGWSIEFNYRIILARKPALVILCDINQRVFDFFDLFKIALIESYSQDDFLSKLKEILEKESDYFFHQKEPRYSLYSTLQSYMTWISCEENYRYLKEMYMNDKIIHLQLDIKDKKNKFELIKQWIDSNGYTLDTLYLSNIWMWLKKDRDLFAQNINNLMHENCIFIDSHNSLKRELRLRITYGSLPY